MAAIAANPLQRLIAIGFIAGVLGILVFHQPTIALLQLIEGRPLSVYRWLPSVPPIGVPTIVNACFWGGLWGIVFYWLVRRFRGRWPAWAIGLVAGVVLTAGLGGWLIVPLIKGTPIFGGFNWPTMWRSPLIHGMFGLGSALFAELLEKRI
jgi:hypothetical protein